MPRNGSGTFTLVSGNPVVTGTTIESNWANTTLSDIATAMTDSLSRSGQGGMTAALRIADGTQGAPGLGFANETGSGLYRAGTAEVWAVVQGAQTMKIDSTGVTVPAAKATSIEGTFVFNETGADKDARFEGDTDVNLLFTDASTDRVGIGTNTPTAKLHVVGDVTVSGAVNAATVNATTLDLTNLEVTNIKAKDGTAAATITDSTGVVNFAADVGVGASTPTFGSGSGVEIQRAGIATLRLENSSASNSFELYADTAANGINLRGRDSSPMNFWTANTLQMTLDSSGNLGLGVTPSAWGSGAKSLEGIGGALTFFDSTNDQLWLTQNAYWDGSWKYKTTNYATSFQQYLGSHVWFTAPSGTAGNAISFTQAMTLDASGQLGIGITSPNAPLEVLSASTGNTIQTAASLYYPNNTGGGGSGVRLDFAANNSGSGRAVYSSIWSLIQSNSAHSGDLVFGTANSGTVAERARITSGGDLLVGTTDASQSSGQGVKLKASDGANLNVVCSASANTTTNMHLYSMNAGAYRFYVGMGGTVYATSTTISAISDARFKENVRDLDVGLDAVMALKPRLYDWKDGKGADTKNARGFIAQEFEQVFPDLIDEWKDPAPEGEEPYKSVRQDLIPVLVKAIQEQQALITALTARVAALEAQP